MLTAQAQVKTHRSSRYLVQLCRHAAAMGDIDGDRPRTHGGSAAPAGHEVQLQAEWSDTHGTVSFAPRGRCTLQASEDTLTLRVEATDEGTLRRLQEVLTRNLERFGRRDRLTVAWQQPVTPAVRPGDADPVPEPHPGPAAPVALARRGHRTTMVLATAGALGCALAVAVHLGLGAAVLAAWHWWGWTAVGLVVTPVVVILSHAVVPMAVLGMVRPATRRRAYLTSVRDN